MDVGWIVLKNRGEIHIWYLTTFSGILTSELVAMENVKNSLYIVLLSLDTIKNMLSRISSMNGDFGFQKPNAPQTWKILLIEGLTFPHRNIKED